MPNMPSAFRSSRLLSLFAGVFGGLLALSLLAPPLQAQNATPTQQQKATHYSLYYENFKNDSYKAARSDLQWMIENAPGFPKNDDRNFRRQYKLYVGLAKKSTKKSQRTAYLDTAATVLSTAPRKMKELGLNYEKYEWELYRGRFLQQYGDALSSRPKGLTSVTAHYRTAFDLAPNEIDPYYIRKVLRTLLDENQQDEALAFLKTVETKREKDDEVQDILSSVRNDIFGKNPQAKVDYLKKQYEAHPDSAGVMLSLFNAYVEQGNIEKASELAPKLMNTNPPAETVRQIAEMRLDDGRPEDALAAYDQAVQQGATLQAQDHFNRGKAHQQLNNFQKARSAYRKALDLDAGFAKAYIGIGDLYARAVNECSDGELGRSDKAVYWAAVDKYQQAIETDSSMASVAQSKINSYKDVFPTQEDIFYRDDWEEGGTTTIDEGCYAWINETTTVRQAP